MAPFGNRNGFQKGVSGNPKGKPKGSKNKDTRLSRDVLLNLVRDVGGEAAFLELYKKQDWARRLLWSKYFDLIPKSLDIGVPDKTQIKFEMILCGDDGHKDPV